MCYGLPPEFASYLNYCRSLRFEDRPDYSHLRKMFKELLVKEGYEYDYAFDWVILNDKLVNQSVLAMVDNGEDPESKQSSVVGQGDDADKDKNLDDEDKEDKDSDDEERKAQEEAKKAEEEAATLAAQTNSQADSLLGGEAQETVKKTSIMEKLASQQQKPTKKFLMQGNEGADRNENIKGIDKGKPGKNDKKNIKGGKNGKKKDGCNV